MGLKVMELPKAVFCWSGGKDSAYALHKVLSEKTFDVKYLLTTVNEKSRRISMHGVRETLLHWQADSVGIPLLKVYVNEGTNEEYELQMATLLLQVKAEGISDVIFGDIFLEDLRVYREANLKKIGMTAIFPLWKTDTRWMMDDILNKGFKTITCCVHSAHLPKDWVGKIIDRKFMNLLPSGIDPCGENGEYHTFCFDGPVFRNAIPVRVGEKVHRTYPMESDKATRSPAPGFWFCELSPILND